MKTNLITKSLACRRKNYKRQKSLACRRKDYKRQKEETNKKKAKKRKKKKKHSLSNSLHLDSKKKTLFLVGLLISWCWK